MTVEQMVREVLAAAWADAHLSESLAAGAAPQSFTAGELVGPANRLAAMLVAVEGRAKAAERERIAGLFAGAAGRVKVRNASGERVDLISPELGDEIAAAILQSPSS
jgi:hypothetical protein